MVCLLLPVVSPHRATGAVVRRPGRSAGALSPQISTSIIVDRIALRSAVHPGPARAGFSDATFDGGAHVVEATLDGLSHDGPWTDVAWTRGLLALARREYLRIVRTTLLIERTVRTCRGYLVHVSVVLIESVRRIGRR
jgi:hypothetical protein